MLLVHDRIYEKDEQTCEDAEGAEGFLALPATIVASLAGRVAEACQEMVFATSISAWESGPPK